MYICTKIGEESGRVLKNLKRAATEFLNRTPALIREASQYAGVLPQTRERPEV